MPDSQLVPAAGGWDRVRETMLRQPLTLAVLIGLMPLIGTGMSYVANREAAATASAKAESNFGQLKDTVQQMRDEMNRSRDRQEASISTVIANAATTSQAVITMQTQIAILQRDQDRERDLNERRQQSVNNALSQLRELTARALQGTTSVRPNEHTMDPSGPARTEPAVRRTAPIIPVER